MRTHAPRGCGAAMPRGAYGAQRTCTQRVCRAVGGARPRARGEMRGEANRHNAHCADEKKCATSARAFPSPRVCTAAQAAMADAEEELVDYEEEAEEVAAAGGDEAAKAAAAPKKGYVGIHATGFKDFLLKPEILRAIVDCGFEHPSEGSHPCEAAKRARMHAIRVGLLTCVCAVFSARRYPPCRSCRARAPEPRLPAALQPAGGSSAGAGRCWLVQHASRPEQRRAWSALLLPRSSLLAFPDSANTRIARARASAAGRRRFRAPAVQHECIPQAILGMDVICQAKSGMGKTAVFVISVLQQLEITSGEVGALIMCHTRELAYQVRVRSLLAGVFFGWQMPLANLTRQNCPHPCLRFRFRTSLSASAATCRT
jgi:hypothetical protein